MKNLLDSDIFCHKLEFDNHEWPQTHTDPVKLIKPFNGSIFDLRNCYNQVFEDFVANEEDQKMAKKDYGTRLYKIKYTLNLLSIMEIGEEDSVLMDLIGDTEMIEILNTKSVQDLIFFKWQEFG